MDQTGVREPTDLLGCDPGKHRDGRHRGDQGAVRRVGHVGSLAPPANLRHPGSEPVPDSKKPGPYGPGSKLSVSADQTFLACTRFACTRLAWTRFAWTRFACTRFAWTRLADVFSAFR